jgi:hypothetical protein
MYETILCIGEGRDEKEHVWPWTVETQSYVYDLNKITVNTKHFGQHELHSSG